MEGKDVIGEGPKDELPSDSILTFSRRLRSEAGTKATRRVPCSTYSSVVMVDVLWVSARSAASAYGSTQSTCRARRRCRRAVPSGGAKHAIISSRSIHGAISV